MAVATDQDISWRRSFPLRAANNATEKAAPNIAIPAAIQPASPTGTRHSSSDFKLSHFDPGTKSTNKFGGEQTSRL
jgi:hypothetical protein